MSKKWFSAPTKCEINSTHFSKFLNRQHEMSVQIFQSNVFDSVFVGTRVDTGKLELTHFSLSAVTRDFLFNSSN